MELKNNNESNQNLIMLQNNEDDDTIDVLRLAKGLLDHWISIILITVLLGGIGFSVSKFVITPKYASTAELYVLSKSTSITSLADIQMGSNLTNDYIMVVTDRPVLEKVIKNLDLDMTTEALENMISVNNPSDSRLLDITVTGPDAEQNKEIVDEVADVVSDFIAEKMNQDPPSIISYGYSDGEKVSPNITKYTILAAILGFIISAAIAIIKTLVNDVIESPADIEEKLGIILLGTLPMEENIGGAKKSRRRKQ